MKSIGLLLLLSITCTVGALQVVRLPGLQSDSVSSQGSAKLDGTVLDALSGRPVAGAEVRLATGRTAFPEDNVPVGFPGPDTFPKPPYSTKTDDSGRFSIPGIRPGTYVVGVSAKGYPHYEVGGSSTNLAGNVPVDIATDSAKPLTVRLTPGATLSGRIRTDEREPLKGVQVYLSKQTADVNGGNKSFYPMATTLTSESGGYEFTDVPWGPYYIFAGRGASLIPTVRSQPLYGWNFYPGNSDASRASRIDASPGAMLGGLDLVVKEQPSRRILGMVIDSRTGKPPEKANVFLSIPSPFRGSGGENSVKYDPANGKFEVTGLIDGTYAIRVKLNGPTSAADNNLSTFSRDTWEEFEISGTDRDDILIHVPRSGYIRGRIILEGNRSLEQVYPAKPPSTPVPRNPSLPAELFGPRVVLTPTTKLQPATTSAIGVDFMDGTFEVSNVLSGRYRLTVANLPAGYFLKDVRQNGTTTSDVFLDFRPEGKDQLDITISPGAGEVNGVVVNERREPLPGSMGLLLPDPLPYEIGNYHSFIADNGGNFSVRNIRPGKYRIYVFDDLFNGEFPGPDMYRRSSALATPVVVTERSQLSITARAINPK